jgi:hypothetical protein
VSAVTGEFEFDTDTRLSGDGPAFTAQMTDRWSGMGGIEYRSRTAPVPGWLACRAQTRYLAGGYREEDFEAWDSAGALVAQSRQLALVLG